MNIVYFNPALKKKWDEFCANQVPAWFCHTVDWIEYCQNSRFNVNVKNHSFVVIINEKIVAVVPLLIEETLKDGLNIREFTFSGGPTPKYVIDHTIGKKLYNKVKDAIWCEIEFIAKKQGVFRFWVRENTQNIFFLLSNALEDFLDKTVLVKNGFLDTSVYSSIVCLNKDENFLMLGMRKGHHSAIKKYLKFLIIKYYDSDTVSLEKMEQFREMYFCIARKITRPYKAFDILFNFIRSGNGILFEACFDSKVIGYSYIIIYKNYAYYAMSCVDTDYKDYNVSHYLQWQIFLRLKQLGILFYEIGEQYFQPTIFYRVSDKLKSISAFKRGFGGGMILQISGEYFYDKDFFKKTFDERTQRYIMERWK